MSKATITQREAAILYFKNLLAKSELVVDENTTNALDLSESLTIYRFDKKSIANEKAGEIVVHVHAIDDNDIRSPELTESTELRFYLTVNGQLIPLATAHYDFRFDWVALNILPAIPLPAI